MMFNKYIYEDDIEILEDHLGGVKRLYDSTNGYLYITLPIDMPDDYIVNCLIPFVNKSYNIGISVGERKVKSEIKKLWSYIEDNE